MDGFAGGPGFTVPGRSGRQSVGAQRLGVLVPTTVFIGAYGVVRGRRVGELNASRRRDAIRSYVQVAVL